MVPPRAAGRKRGRILIGLIKPSESAQVGFLLFSTSVRCESWAVISALYLVKMRLYASLTGVNLDLCGTGVQ